MSAPKRGSVGARMALITKKPIYHKRVQEARHGATSRRIMERRITAEHSRIAPEKDRHVGIRPVSDAHTFHGPTDGWLLKD